MIGIDKLKEKLFQRALGDFSMATGREEPTWELGPNSVKLAVSRRDVFKRCGLFAEIMIISFQTTEESGPCFRQLTNLTPIK